MGLVSSDGCPALTRKGRAGCRVVSVPALSVSDGSKQGTRHIRYTSVRGDGCREVRAVLHWVARWRRSLLSGWVWMVLVHEGAGDGSIGAPVSFASCREVNEKPHTLGWSVRLRGCIQMSDTQVDCDSADSSSDSSFDSGLSDSGGATYELSKLRWSSSPLRVALRTFFSCRSPERSISDTGSSM